MANQQLIDYIQAEEAQGYTPEQLKAFLVSKGYTSMQADEAINYAAQNKLHPKLKPEHVQSLSESIHVVPAGAIVVATLLVIAGLFMSFTGISAIATKQAAVSMTSSLGALTSSAEDADDGMGFVDSFGDFSFLVKIGAVLLVLGLVHFGIAWGLLFAKKWGWYSAIILAILYSVLAIALVGIVSVFTGFMSSLLLAILPVLLLTALFLLLLMHKKTKAGYF